MQRIFLIVLLITSFVISICPQTGREYETPKVREAKTTVAPSRGQAPIQIVERGETKEEKINKIVKEVCGLYNNVKPELVESIIFHESRYDINAKNNNCVGLMQISTYFHKARAKKLGVTDFYDPYDNVLLGVDYLSELFSIYEDPALVLMVYNSGPNNALTLYKKGKISNYAYSVLEREKQIKGVN